MASRPSEFDLEECVLLSLGASESGKSRASNFIADEEEFPTRDSLPTLTGQTFQLKIYYDRTLLCLIDTVRLKIAREGSNLKD